MTRGTVCSNVCTYGSVGALGGQPPRATRPLRRRRTPFPRHRRPRAGGALVDHYGGRSPRQGFHATAGPVPAERRLTTTAADRASSRFLRHRRARGFQTISRTAASAATCGIGIVHRRQDVVVGDACAAFSEQAGRTGGLHRGEACRSGQSSLRRHRAGGGGRFPRPAVVVNHRSAGTGPAVADAFRGLP